MALAVTHNNATQFSLGELNKNIAKTGKALARISSGLRIVGAQDDSATFAISERMREKIRSLRQDTQNVQNGSSMIRTAERGIDQIIQNMRTMKELAIDSANDSNTDEDRTTIQKEFNALRDTINDIAIGTQYNGKILLDGRWSKKIVEKVSGTVDEGGAFINSVTGFFNLPKTTMQKTGEMAWADGKTAYRNPANNYVPLSFTGLNINGSPIKFPNDLDEQGFSILCTFSFCPSFYGFVFDTDMAVSDYEVQGTDDAPVYVIGIEDADTPEKVAEALFNAVAAATDQTGSDIIRLNAHGSDVTTLRREGSSYSISHNYDFFLYEGYGAEYVSPPPGNEVDRESKFNPLWVQHGTQTGQHTNFYINDMQVKALGLEGVEVTTRDKATAAIASIESALERALDEATTMGAYLQRLEYTETNVTTMGENVQASESTIRDADMAKEMVEYAKNNLLSQSSQSMLAQANQAHAQVLNLLG